MCEEKEINTDPIDTLKCETIEINGITYIVYEVIYKETPTVYLPNLGLFY